MDHYSHLAPIHVIFCLLLVFLTRAQIHATILQGLNSDFLMSILFECPLPGKTQHLITVQQETVHNFCFSSIPNAPLANIEEVARKQTR